MEHIDILGMIEETHDTQEMSFFFNLYREVNEKRLLKLLSNYKAINQNNYEAQRQFYKKLNKKDIIYLFLFCNRFEKTVNECYWLRNRLVSFNLE